MAKHGRKSVEICHAAENDFYCREANANILAANISTSPTDKKRLWRNKVAPIDRIVQMRQIFSL